MEEIWKDIPGYEGLYEISNIGKVRSVTRIVRHPKPRTLKGRILKMRIRGKDDRRKYFHITLHKIISDNKYEWRGFLIHRLVALTFIQNPDNLPCVNHLDANKFNNVASNLEWCTHKQNMQHAGRSGLMSAPKRRRKLNLLMKSK